MSRFININFFFSRKKKKIVPSELYSHRYYFRESDKLQLSVVKHRSSINEDWHYETAIKYNGYLFQYSVMYHENGEALIKYIADFLNDEIQLVAMHKSEIV